MRRALMEFDEPSRSSSITTWRGLRTGTEPGTTPPGPSGPRRTPIRASTRHPPGVFQEPLKVAAQLVRRRALAVRTRPAGYVSAVQASVRVALDHDVESPHPGTPPSCILPGTTLRRRSCADFPSHPFTSERLVAAS